LGFDFFVYTYLVKRNNNLSKSYYQTVSTVFAVVGVLHLIRIIFQLDVYIQGYEVPMSISVGAVAVTFYLTFRGYSLARKR